jgi:hypothetical protein
LRPPETTFENPPEWPERYYNAERGKFYEPHHQEEAYFVADNSKRWLLAKGGEGGGKSVCGIIRDLDRIKAGCHGIMISPDFEHFKRSLWPEFRRWCPWEFIVPRQRYRRDPAWEPGRPFQLNFTTGATVYCGGMKESEVMSWEGPNVNWAHFDECRRHDTAAAIKVLDGRVRIPMGGYMPQIWLTTTPRKNWLFDYFGPMKQEDERADFKADALIMTLLTLDNEPNLESGFVAKRSKSLTASEIRVLLEAEWEDIEHGQRFLPSITLWDALKFDLPIWGKEPMVLAADAAVGSVSGLSDCFGLVGVTRHTDPKYRNNQVFVRYIRKWQAKAGEKIDFDKPRGEIRRLCSDPDHPVVMVCYDRHQLHDMMQQLARENLSWFFEFDQGDRRLTADRQLLDLVQERWVWHTGDHDLRQHLDNSDRKLSDDGNRLRIVKREDALKVDLAVCLAMGCHEIMRLNV